MSKRDIILFDIGRKTTGFSEKNLRRKLRTSSTIHNFTSIPAPSFGQHTEQTSHFFTGFHMEYTMIGPAASLATEQPTLVLSLLSAQLLALGLDTIWKTPILEYPYMRIILIWVAI